MFKKLSFLLAVLVITQVVHGHKQNIYLAQQRKQEQTKEASQKLSIEQKPVAPIVAPVEPQKPQEQAPAKPPSVPASPLSCREAIAQVFPKHLQAGAITVLVHENRKEDPLATGKMNRNGSRDYGCFQINDAAHKAFFATKDWKNPLHNAQEALNIYNGRGNWTAWYAVRGILW